MLDGGDLLSLSGMFVSALVAATIFPAQSEAVLVGLVLQGEQDLSLLFLVATVGNVLGAVVNWLLGRFLVHYRDRKWFPVSAAGWARAEGWYQRFGIWSLLFAWAPLIGDPLTVIAGALRVDLGRFVLLVTLGKAVRYLVLMAATLGWTL